VRFDLGLGLYDLEKIFVTMVGGHVQLFSNRYLRYSNDSYRYTTNEIEKIKQYVLGKVKESIPYANLTVGLVERNNMDKTSDVNNKRGLAGDAIVRVKEVELTIGSHNIKYLPTFQKFNALMDDVVYCFEKHIINQGIGNNKI
jgi:hypothetical protein